jgi:hypothetical protein
LAAPRISELVSEYLDSVKNFDWVAGEWEVVGALPLTGYKVYGDA